MSTIKANKLEHISTSNGGIQLDNAGHVTVDGVQLPTAGALSHRNLIINGDCRVSQRTTASQSHSAAGSIYGVDRFYAYANVTGKVTVQQNQGSVTPPAGFQNYVGMTSSGSYTSAAGNVFSFGQPIEAQNAEQLAWGTADAKAVTLSFWVRSSLTGTFGGAFLKQGLTRSYPYSYTISAANTWEYKTITIPGDTNTGISYNMSGNGLFGYFIWDYGSGDNLRGTAGAWTSGQKEGVTGTNRLVNTSGATWYITGIQLEVGSKATSFEHRSYGDELARCQRYYNMVAKGNGATMLNFAVFATNNAYGVLNFPVHMRATPTVDSSDGTGHFQFSSAAAQDNFDTLVAGNGSERAIEFRANSSGGLGIGTAGNAGWVRLTNASAFIGVTAEL